MKALISHVFLVFKLCFNIHAFSFDSYSSINMNLILIMLLIAIFSILCTIVYVSTCIAVYVVPIHFDLQRNSNDLKLGNTGKIV